MSTTIETPDILSTQVSTSGSSSDSDDVCRPPRYSLLTGALPGPGSQPSTGYTSNGGSRSAAYPPRYSTVFHTTTRDSNQRRHERGPLLERDARLASASGPKTYEYHISSSGVKNKPWTTLKVYSCSPASSLSSGQGQKVPKFNGSDLVRGSLDLDLEMPQTINSISLSLRGQIITSSYNDGVCTFLDLPVVTWTRANGDPRTMILPEGDSSSSSRRTKKFDGKFDGQSNTVFPLPPTFLERGTNGNVQYNLVVRMSHGMLRSDSRLQVGIVYVPNILPGPSSELCQLAYSQRQSIPSPEVDPTGWCILPSTTITGRMLKEKVKWQCTTSIYQLSLSNPLCYARGTIIPCHLSIRCKDPQALDLLSKPQSIVVCLVRRVQYDQDVGQSFLASNRSMNSNDIGGSMVLDVAQMEKAVWWADTDGTETNDCAHNRQVKGEIHLRKDLQPSCEFPLFNVSYTVDLLAFDAPAISISGWRTDHQTNKYHSSKTILNHPVTIATVHGEGPVPIPVTTPKPRKNRTAADLRTATEFNSGTIALGTAW